MKKNDGFTLIEIMIALVLGLIIIGATLNIYIATIKGSSDTVKSARLNYDLDMAMQFMVNDIRRSGYWGGAVTGSTAADNPFIDGTGNIQLVDPVTAGSTEFTCILYTYDADGDVALDIDDGSGTNEDTNEFYGFKFDSGAIKISSANTVDDTGDCTKTDGRWANILDSDNIQVTALTFTATNSKCLNTTTDEVFPGTCAAAIAAAGGVTGKISSGDQAVENRQIDISLTGRVINDTTVEKTLTAIVKVRNNRIFVQP